MTKQSEHKIEADPEPPNFAKLTKLAAEIQTQGYDESTAAHYAVLIGKKVRVQVDSPQELPVALTELVTKIRDHIEKESAYRSAITQSRFIQGLRIVTGHEIGRFKK